ncbi:MAG: PEP-CTERM sorting domain-containing protein [Verrucomicrobiota bacterium]|nr:PEP-CTERM sorting domain-containing protein [Verrucomicrobiota bacterium]
MKINLIKSIIVGIFLLVSRPAGFSQGFMNLNFESAKIIPATGSPFYPYGIDVTNALPGWAVFIGSNQATQITYNAPAIGSTFVTLWATNGQQISGNFGVLLQGGGTAASASISQTALVPASTRSILFQAQPYGFNAGGSLLISFGGQNIPFFALSTGANYTLYGGEISAFAGQTEQLTIAALNQPGFYPNNWNIDNIQFSSSAVPEPSTIALAIIGFASLGWFCRRK